MKRSPAVTPASAEESTRHVSLVDVIVDARTALFELAVRTGLQASPAGTVASEVV